MLGLAALVSFTAGCGSTDFPVRPAKGQVLCDGKPVASGSITFTPMGDAGKRETGKPASGQIGSDGRFTLTTYERFDGAIVGKHQVQYNGPENDEQESEESSDEEKTVRKKKAAGAVPSCIQKGEIILEVKASGTNDFTIELSSTSKK